LDQDLANSHGSATVSQTLLHGLTSSHDGDTADFPLEHEPIVGVTNRSGDIPLNDRKVVQSFFNKQTDDAVGVKDEIGSVSILVTDHAARTLVPILQESGMGPETYDSSAIN
jgi:hypothetical protein